MLLIGYPLFWLELAWPGSRDGTTTPLAWILFGLFVLMILARRMNRPVLDIAAWRNEFTALSGPVKGGMIAGVLVSVVILLLAGYASFFPPHLIQEFDVINYHYTIPRQHLIIGSFARIPWASEDLYLLPLDFALAPFWFVTALPNQWPQYIFLLGLTGLLARTGRRFYPDSRVKTAVLIFIFLGSHGYGIQMGTAMLDLMTCYLFFAALDSLLARRVWLCAIEAAFLVWSKSFLPLQYGLLAVVMVGLWLIFFRLGFRDLRWDFVRRIDQESRQAYGAFLPRWGIVFALASICIGGPFVAKSLYYAGTPLYPFAPGLCLVNQDIDRTSRGWKSLVAAAEFSTTRIKDGYGYGRSLAAFLVHPWRLAVPDQGVNNNYDYPLGLPFLLLAGPFVVMGIGMARKKVFAVLPVLVVVFWLTWWLGSQQARFLYIPLLLMFLTVLGRLPKISPALLAGVVLSLVLTGTSVARAHRADFGKTRMEVLRAKDKKIMDVNREYLRRPSRDFIEWEDHEAAFAQFPVVVMHEHLPHTIAFD